MNPTAEVEPGTVAAPNSSAPDDPRVVLALEEYAAALKTGARPDRHAFLAKHPGIAAALGDCLDGLEFIQTAAPLLQAGAPGSPDNTAGELHPEGPLGDYRLVRELGRGGMGVVYEAVQISLGRRVALKVLPFAAALDGKQLQRFKNEAQAASHLHHQNIVPVYGVGCDRGVHHYSMQFIDGQTLSALIQELRHPAGPTDAQHAEQTGLYTPGSEAFADQTATPPVAAISTERSANNPARFRIWARLGVQAAEALEHAHAMGVIHRDIKPANLMVDLRGNLWITDFGLAHCQSQAGLTMTGDLVGTLRYMSPEQALAKRVLVDHRTDIYSLGATLYELLTLEPPFAGGDRQELLRQIAFEEARPLRRLNKAIPAELETIVLKAIEKNPNDRYATAQNLADDLERFMKDEPIRAKRPSLLLRIRKWSRRHQSVVVTAGIAAVGFLLMAVVGLAVNNALITQEKEQTEGALNAETEAKAKLKRALEREQRSSYFQRIGRVDLEWSANNVGRADQILDECPPEYRRWEWRYLKQLCHTDLVTLGGHGQPVHGVAFHPDGQRLASAGEDKAVRIWDLKTGGEIRALRGHSQIVTCVAWSPDGRFLASGSGIWDDRRPGEVKVWDATKGNEHFPLTGPEAAVAAVAFSPDGRQLAAASWDRTVRLWDMTTGQKVRTLRGYDVRCIAFSPDGRLVASGCHNGTIVVWETARGEPQRILRGHTSDVYGVAFSPDGQRLVSGSWDYTIRVWDVASGNPLFMPARHGDVVIAVDFSPDGQRVASGAYDGSVKVWDASTGQELAMVRGHHGPVHRVAFSPGGRSLASASADHTVKVWDLTVEQQGRSFVASARFFRSALSADGKRIAMAMRAPADPKRAIALRVYELMTGREVLHLGECGGGFHGAAFSPDGKRLAADWNKAVKVWEAQAGQQVFTLAGHSGLVTSVAFSPDSQRLASASADRTVKVWDAKAGKEILALAGHTETVTSVAFSPDGQRLASASQDHTIKIWDATTGRELSTLKGHDAAVTEVAFSRLGDRLASASEDRTVRVWDCQTWQVILTLPGHTGVVTAVAFSPDGQRLASASLDGSVRLWDVATGQEALTLRRQFKMVYGVAFAHDGERLVAMGMMPAYEGFKIWGTQQSNAEPRAAREEAVKADTQNAPYLRGTFHSRLRRWDLALMDFSAAIQLGLNNAEVWQERGMAYGMLDKLERAAADYGRASEARPEDPWLWYYHATARLGAGDMNGYRGVCARMRERFGKTTDPATAGLLLLTFVLNAQPPADSAEMVRWGQCASQHPGFYRAWGQGLYRAGQYNAAVRRLQEVRFEPLRGDDLLFLAMAQHQLGKVEEARGTFTRATDWIKAGDRTLADRGFWHWCETVGTKILHKEAEALFKGKGSDN